jgi:hypothetical protein
MLLAGFVGVDRLPDAVHEQPMADEAVRVHSRALLACGVLGPWLSSALAALLRLGTQRVNQAAWRSSAAHGR